MPGIFLIFKIFSPGDYVLGFFSRSSLEFFCCILRKLWYNVPHVSYVCIGEVMKLTDGQISLIILIFITIVYIKAIDLCKFEAATKNGLEQCIIDDQILWKKACNGGF